MTVAPKTPHKTIYILPNLFTTGSIFLGFLAMLYTTQEMFQFSAVLIILGSLCDGLDGKVARMTNTASEFGVQYDSLADVITFGVAPAFLMYHWNLWDYQRLGVVLSFLYITCGALRLARFNISTAVISKKFFIGMPIPVAAGSLCTLVFFESYLQEHFSATLPPILIPIFVFCISLLMVSQVRYFSFKEFGILQARPFSTLLIIVLCLAALALQPSLLSFIFAITYAISGILYTYILLPRRKNQEASQQRKITIEE